MVIFCAWCSAYYLNEWLFLQFILVKNFISWVFLPAAIRVLAVLLAGWIGVVGDFLGMLIVLCLIHFLLPKSHKQLKERLL